MNRPGPRIDNKLEWSGVEKVGIAMFRQDDVLIVPIAAVPANVTALRRESGGVVLAYGEATGHAHVIRGRHAWRRLLGRNVLRIRKKSYTG
jgi:hypothetical protein